MRRWRGPASVLVVCAVVIGGVIAAILVTRGNDESTPRAATSGPLAPLRIARPSVPVIGGGIPVDLEPLIEPIDFGTALTFLPGKNRYRITISNTSTLGAINSFQWYPPAKVHILKVLGSSVGNCTLRGLTGFGGNQFPGLVLHPDVLCKQARSQATELHLPRRRRRRGDLVRDRQGAECGRCRCQGALGDARLPPHPRVSRGRRMSTA